MLQVKAELKTEFSNDDIRRALSYNGQEVLKYEDIAGLLAEAPGHNDEDEWYWVGQLKDGRFFAAVGGCDYTGWDCQSHLNSWVHANLSEVLKDMVLSDSGKLHVAKVDAIADQLDGRLPFGLEVRT